MKIRFKIIVLLFLTCLGLTSPSAQEDLEAIFGDSVGGGSEQVLDDQIADESDLLGGEEAPKANVVEPGQGAAKIFISPDQQLYKEDSVNFKGEKSSLIRWGDVEHDDFLDFRQWKVDLKVKETEPRWRRNLQERRLREKVGYVIECVGECRSFRGVGYARVDYLSTLREGDELQTMPNSYLWIYLMDGTMVRLAPNSTITLKEMNIGKKENFVFLRLNAGNILVWSRSGKKFKPQNFKETDPIFYPLSMLDANPDTQILKVDEEDLFAYLEKGIDYNRKYSRLNELIEKNGRPEKKTLYFLVMPNGTIFGENLVAEFIVLTGNKSYFKLRDEEQIGLAEVESRVEPTLYYRGFKNDQTSKVDFSQWYEIGAKGRESRVYDEPKRFAIGEFLTKNIPTILVAREIFYKNYSAFTQQSLSEENLATNYGYRLWEPYEKEDSDLNLRVQFLVEYTRRAETTNLLAAEQFKKRIERRGEKWSFSIYSRDFYEDAIGKFYNYRDGVSILSGTGETLNSERKPYWKLIHGLK